MTNLARWEELTHINTPCYGAVIFNLNPNKEEDKCVIVRTPKKENDRGWAFGFPKGKKHKKENIFVCTEREIKEETGINFNQLEFANYHTFSELSNKNVKSITYMVAKFNSDPHTHIFTFDHNELEFSGWMLISDIMQLNMFESRKQILLNAYEIVCNHSTEFTPGSILLDNFSGVKNISTNPSTNPSTNVSTDTLTNTTNLSNKEFLKISKFISYVLRHGTLKLNIPINDEGYVNLSDLLSQPELNGIGLKEIEYIVQTNDKKRYELKYTKASNDPNNSDNLDGVMIRATQGHSKIMESVIDETKLLEEILIPLEKCVHGTNKNAWEFIKDTGLKVMDRMHIHFSIAEPESTTVISGMKHNAKVLIYINMELAMKDGIKFYMSKNKVILSSGINGTILPKYFSKIEIR